MSSIAVFLVLGGTTAFAASQLGKNSVGSKQLKKNAVTAAKLKKDAVTGAKIKSGAVTGAKIDEGSLGTVPRAATATSATSAASASSAAVADSLKGYSHKFVRLTPTPSSGFTDASNNGPETVLFTAGPISITAKCFLNGGSVYGMFQIKSSTDGTIFDSDYDQIYSNPLLGPGTPGENRELYYQSSSTSYYVNSPQFTAIAADGTAVRGDLQVGVKKGNLPGGNGAFGEGDVCLMAATMFTL
jgi:hypothetical protein